MALPVATAFADNGTKASFKKWFLTAADGDSGEVLFNHGIVDENGNGVIPQAVYIIPVDVSYYLGQWTVTSFNTTQVGVTKNVTGVGTGTAVALQIVVARPHTSILS